MKMPLAALHESAIGPTQTSGDVRYRIALGGQAGHQPAISIYEYTA